MIFSGEVFYTITTNNELLVEAKKQCEVLFYTYDDIHTKCKKQLQISSSSF